MTGHCSKCRAVRNLERVNGPVGTVAFRCKLCGTAIPVGDQEQAKGAKEEK